MGYSLCIVAIFGHFQNALTFRILAFFSSRFLHRTTVMCLKKHFWHVLGFFFEPFFAKNNCNVFKETFFACFRQVDFLIKIKYFAWAIYCLCIVAIFGNFQNALIFGILAVFSSHFLHRTTVMCLKNRFSHVLGFFFEPFFAKNNCNVFKETFFACFRQFYFLTQTEYFAWAIAFALWPFLAIFKMLSFLEYWLFFRAIFCIEQL